MPRLKQEHKKEKVISLRVYPEFEREYREFCKKNKFVFVNRLRALMEMDIRGKIKG